MSTTETATDHADATAFWDRIQAALQEGGNAETPAAAANGFWRAAMLLASTALHLHPEARNYLVGTVVDEVSLRTATISASWDDGVSPLRRLSILEREMLGIAAFDQGKAGVTARAALNRACVAVTTALPVVDELVEQLRSLAGQLGRASAGDAVSIEDQLAALRDRLPSGGPIVDRLVAEVVRCHRLAADAERSAPKPMDTSRLADLREHLSVYPPGTRLMLDRDAVATVLADRDYQARRAEQAGPSARELASILGNVLVLARSVAVDRTEGVDGDAPSQRVADLLLALDRVEREADVLFEINHHA